jgi:hypothetical protein
LWPHSASRMMCVLLTGNKCIVARPWNCSAGTCRGSLHRRACCTGRRATCWTCAAAVADFADSTSLCWGSSIRRVCRISFRRPRRNSVARERTPPKYIRCALGSTWEANESIHAARLSDSFLAHKTTDINSTTDHGGTRPIGAQIQIRPPMSLLVYPRPDGGQ